MTASKITLMRELPLFSGCTKSELRRLANLGTPLGVPRGRLLTSEGKLGMEAFVVIEGEAVCSSGRKETARFGPGDLFGEIGVLDRGPRTATVVARTSMELLVFTRREIEAMLARSPHVALYLAELMAERLRAAYDAAHVVAA